jgi:hypothetical protein
MNIKKQQQIVNGLSSVERKIYDTVPISDGWTTSKICAEMSRKGIQNGHPIVNGVILGLINSGLVKEIGKGIYTRTKAPETTARTGIVIIDQTATNPENKPMLSGLFAKLEEEKRQKTIFELSPIDSFIMLNKMLVNIKAAIDELQAEIGSLAIVVESKLEYSEKKVEELSANQNFAETKALQLKQMQEAMKVFVS